MKEMIVTYKIGDSEKFSGYRGTWVECEKFFKAHLLAGYKIQFGPVFKLA